MCTEFCFASKLRHDTDSSVIKMLNWLCAPHPDIMPYTFEHPFFECGRWDRLFTSSSEYFSGTNHRLLTYSDVNEYWALDVRSSLKNYGQEIHQFFSWIAQYCYIGFLGYSFYEEDTEPILYYHLGNGVLYFGGASTGVSYERE